ncbi:16S rRNA (uracil(1498)-N(3))-methyltransferase [Candidatus Desantisbacteria bacterium]|nr:16S rRNA (uracil(1498)-N(3))-methyltransferase [Candidatus Desantisbacteria bacterium]
MNHNRFFVSPSQISQTHIKITDTDNLHHIKVIRLRINDEIIVLDGKGNEYRAKISNISRDQITAKIVDKKVHPSPTLQMTIVQSIPKLDKVNLIVEKCTELGVSRIVLVETNRSVKKQINLSRLERIAISASSQSGRIFLPMIEEARFCDALENAECGMRNAEKEVRSGNAPYCNVLGLMLWENAEKGIGEILRLSKGLTLPEEHPLTDGIHLPEWLPSAISAFPARVVLFVGPEGGFSQEEADEAVKKGIIPVSLGNQILRTETAGLVGLTIIAYEMGLMN